MHSFNELKKLAKNPVAGKKITVAVMADSSTQFLATALKGTGVAQNANYEIWEADYNQIDRQVFDPGSEFYQSESAYAVVLRSSEHLLDEFYKTPVSERQGFANTQLEYLASLIQQIGSRSKCKIITNTYFEINDSVFGNYANKVPASFIYQVRKLNLGLMDLAQQNKNLFLLDLASLIGQKGYSSCFDPKLYINAEMVYNLDVLPDIAFNIHAVIQSINGQFKKCLILDLDNTTWGGIIGDDGVGGIKVGHLGIGQAFSNLQQWAKELKNRGIILAVCSKNTESIAKEPFEQHPDMVLRLDDIAIFVANWENKVDNIKYIQSILNIGFDSMVFLDDNPFEREMVKSGVPGLTVPDLPEDPVDYLPYLRTLNLFETASYTEEDSERTKQYQEEAKRTIVQKSFANEDDFLQSLDMTSEVKPFDTFSIPRVAQLSQRSNQFNLRTVRYTEEDVVKVAADKNSYTLSFTLKDKFGDNGLISLIILHKKEDALFIDTWIMSCRVLKRGMENFVLNTIVDLARENGFKKIIGEYIPTAKNAMVKEHYPNLGFSEAGDLFELDVAPYKDRKSFIKKSV